jgi:hypothetical protein
MNEQIATEIKISRGSCQEPISNSAAHVSGKGINSVYFTVFCGTSIDIHGNAEL